MRILIGLMTLLLTLTAWGYDKEDVSLNRINLRLSAEQWVTSKTALVTVGVNAGISDSRVEKLQEEVLKKLNDISNQGEWHIVSLDRTQDQSGLEKIQMIAQARLPNSALSVLRDKAKKISKPGETYAVDNIQFTPSEDEFRAANIELRNNIYQQAKAEIDRLNKVLPDQKYYIHNIDFSGNVVAAPMVQNTIVSMRVAAQSIVTKELPVGDKLILNANVTLAAVPEQLLAKMPK